MIYAKNIQRIASDVYKLMSWFDYEDVLSECYLAMLLNEQRKLSCDLDLAVKRDVIDVFRSRKWQNSDAGCVPHISYGLYPDLDEDYCEILVDELIDDNIVKQLLETLSSSDKDLLINYYWNGMTFEAIGVECNVRRQKIGYMHQEILNQLRHTAQKQGMRDD